MAAKGDNSDDDKNETDKVEEETVEVFECFIENRLAIERERNEIAPDTPGLPPEDIPHVPDNKKNTSWQVGLRLAKIGDSIDMDHEYRVLIKNVVDMVNVGPDDTAAFTEFQDIARRVMSRGISWRNIATLFYFGYCIARDRLTRGVQHFLSQLIQWILNVFNQFGVLRWIASQGGWRNFVYNVPQRVVDTPTVLRGGLIIGAAVAFVALAWLLIRRGRSD